MCTIKNNKVKSREASSPNLILLHVSLLCQIQGKMSVILQDVYAEVTILQEYSSLALILRYRRPTDLTSHV